MERESYIILGAAIVCIVIALLLRRAGSGLYNRSAGMGLVLIVFPFSLALFSDLQWLVAILLAPVGASIWWTDLLRARDRA